MCVYYISHMKFNVENLPHYGDMAAIPFFLLTFLYFFSIDCPTLLEKLLMMFSLGGFVCDIFFVFLFLRKHYR